MADTGEYHRPGLGELCDPELLQGCHSHPSGRLLHFGGYALEAHYRVAQDREQRIQEQGQQGWLPSEAQHRIGKDNDCRRGKGLDEGVQPHDQNLKVLSPLPGNPHPNEDTHQRCQGSCKEAERYMLAGHLQNGFP